MATQQSASGKKDGDIRYLTPFKHRTNKIVVSKNLVFKYIDYKDGDFLLKIVNEQGKFFLVV
jgi:small subunit ribosomal protein S18